MKLAIGVKSASTDVFTCYLMIHSGTYNMSKEVSTQCCEKKTKKKHVIYFMRSIHCPGFIYHHQKQFRNARNRFLKADDVSQINTVEDIYNKKV